MLVLRLRDIIRVGYVVSPRGELLFQVPLQEGSAWGLDWNVAAHRYNGAPGFGHGVMFLGTHPGSVVYVAQLRHPDGISGDDIDVRRANAWLAAHPLPAAAAAAAAVAA